MYDIYEKKYSSPVNFIDNYLNDSFGLYHSNQQRDFYGIIERINQLHNAGLISDNTNYHLLKRTCADYIVNSFDL